MQRSASHPPGLNDLLRACALLSLWPRCFDPTIEKYSSRYPTR